MDKHGFVKNKFWHGIQTKTDEDNTIKLKLKKNDKNLYESLNLKELKIIGKELNIKETTKVKIIENILKSDFNYDDWYSKYIDKTTNDKLKIICKYLHP
jgi:D-hexose-6-phosphate mutarotase